MSGWAVRLGPFDRTEVGKVQKVSETRIVATVNGRPHHWPIGSVWLIPNEDDARLFAQKLDGAKGEQDRRISEARVAFRKTVERLAREQIA